MRKGYSENRKAVDDVTLGERIATLRKEKGLSQEGLGEQVGVSRQTVSKWEADRALPDVNNCVSMSRVFGVTLAQLLELKEETEAPGLKEAEDHLKLIEEVAEKYVAANRRSRRRWRWPLILLACAFLVGATWLAEWLTGMNRTIEYLHGEIAGLQNSILSGVGEKVESSIETQYRPILAYTAELIRVDVLEEMATAYFEVTLKEAGADTKVTLQPQSGGTVIQAQPLGGLRYGAEVVCSMEEDRSAVDLVVETDGVRRSQTLWINHFKLDYSLSVGGNVRFTRLKALSEDATEPIEITATLQNGPGLSTPTILKALEVGVFLNDVLVYTVSLTDLAQPDDDGNYLILAERDIPVNVPQAKAGDTLTFAVMARDSLERQQSWVISRYGVLEGRKLEYQSEERRTMNDGTYGLEEWQ